MHRHKLPAHRRSQSPSGYSIGAAECAIADTQAADDGVGGLLEECYQQVKVEVDKVLSAESQFVCITSDAWSNMSNEPVVNYMAVCLTKSLFLEAVHTEEQAHDADWLASDLSRVIDSLGDTVVGAITDNTATNKKVWNELEPKYLTRFFQGCVSHGLHLLVKDIFAAKKKERAAGGLAEYPAGYPFENLLLFANDCLFQGRREPGWAPGIGGTAGP